MESTDHYHNPIWDGKISGNKQVARWIEAFLLVRLLCFAIVAAFQSAEGVEYGCELLSTVTAEVLVVALVYKILCRIPLVWRLVDSIASSFRYRRQMLCFRPVSLQRLRPQCPDCREAIRELGRMPVRWLHRILRARNETGSESTLVFGEPPSDSEELQTLLTGPTAPRGFEMERAQDGSDVEAGYTINPSRDKKS
jgi:hypothetical protein